MSREMDAERMYDPTEQDERLPRPHALPSAGPRSIRGGVAPRSLPESYDAAVPAGRLQDATAARRGQMRMPGATPGPRPALPPRRDVAARPVPPRRGVAYRGLPRPVALAAWAVFAVAIGGALGVTAPPALRRIGELVAVEPSILPWYSVRALGFLAYLAVAASVLYGLLLSTRILDAIAQRPVSFTLHKDLALVSLLLTALHAGLLMADATFSYSIRSLLVPFESPYAPLWVGVGQLAFYAFAVVTASFYVRRQIGQRAWRAIHYLTFLAFVGAAGHGIVSGTDTHERWAFWLYVVPIAATVFLVTYRVVVGISSGLRRHYSPDGGRHPVSRFPEFADGPRMPVQGRGAVPGRSLPPRLGNRPAATLRRSVAPEDGDEFDADDGDETETLAVVPARGPTRRPPPPPRPLFD